CLKTCKSTLLNSKPSHLVLRTYQNITTKRSYITTQENPLGGIIATYRIYQGDLMKKTYFVVAIALGMSAVSFQNCSRVELDFQEVTSREEVLNILSKCSEAEKQNRLRVFEQQIRFEDSHQESGRSQVCEFNRNDNLSQRNDFMQARYEQYQGLNLPANAVICD